MQYHFFANDDFNAKAVYVPGKMLVAADTLKTPFCSATSGNSGTVIRHTGSGGSHTVIMANVKLTSGCEHTKDDPELQMVMHFVRNGWPKYASKVLDNAKTYYTVKDSPH